MNILLIEDNESIARGLEYLFAKNKYSLTCRATAASAREYLASGANVDLAILDISLPDGNGFMLYESDVKPRGIPTVFLTARDGEDDIVRGLDIGAEDYITKPFGTKELLARVNKILLRVKKKSVVRIGDISYDTDKTALYRGEKQIELSAMELRLINLMFANIGKTVTRSAILDKIWEWTGNDVDDHTVTVYFRRIREKIGADIITTVRGIGYRIDEEQDKV